MSFKKLAVAVGVSAAFGMGAAGQANATAVASALIDISNFLITNGAGTPLDLSAFVPGKISFLDTLTNNALLNPGGDDHTVASSSTFSLRTDAAMACVAGPGVCAGIGQNNFSPSSVPPTLTFARGDNLLENVPISGTGFPTGVHAATIAETSLNHVNANGSSDSSIILTSDFQFVLAHDIAGAGLQFDATTFLLAWTAANSAFGTKAGAGFKWEITLVDGVSGAKLIDWVPDGHVGTGLHDGLTETADGCNLIANDSATFNQPKAPAEDCTGHFAATTNFILAANHPYSFTIHQTVDNQAVEVEIPEPGALALLGIGLAGLGFVRRRWS